MGFVAHLLAMILAQAVPDPPAPDDVAKAFPFMLAAGYRFAPRWVHVYAKGQGARLSGRPYLPARGSKSKVRSTSSTSA